MGEINEILVSNLRTAIDKIEGALKSGAKLADEFLLKGELLNKVGQLAETKQRLDAAETNQKEDKARENAAISYLVARETRLTSYEKERYSELLKQEFFTKADFGKMESFYSQSWDKLSDEGKAEMSKRVWEGIHRGEYTFDELPETVKKKEAEWMYQQISGKKEPAAWLANVPEKDKADFIRAHEAKDEKAIEEILERKGFSQKVTSGITSSKEVTGAKNTSVGKDQDSEADKNTTEGFGTLAATFDANPAPKNPTDIQTGAGSQRVR